MSCYDAVGNEIQPTYALVRVEEDGTETPIGIESGCFVPDQNGSYKLTITAQAEGGVPATKEILYEAAYDEGKRRLCLFG